MDVQDLVKVQTLRAFPWNGLAFDPGAELMMSVENAQLFANAEFVERVQESRKGPEVGPKAGLVDRALWADGAVRRKR